MGISGYEALVMSTVSPFLLSVKPLRSLVVGNLRMVHLLSLAGVLAYLVKDPVYRLFTVGFAVWMQCLAWSATFYAASVNEGRLESRILAWLAGLLMSSIVKFAWYTNNPIWPIMHAANGGINGAGAVLAVLACLRFTRKAPLQAGSLEDSKRGGSSLPSAFALGGLFFGLHSLLSDTSTMILWVWEGYPIRGPFSNTHAWCTIAAMTGGILLGLYRPGLVSTWSAYGVGCVGAALLTCYGNWTGYYGALIVAVYLMAVAVPLLTAASKKGSPATAFGLGFLLYNLMVLFHVWVVAYAFVPGGPLVREHTDWVMTTTMLLLGAGVFDLASSPQTRRSYAPPPPPEFKDKRLSSPAWQHRKYHVGGLAILNILFLCAAFMRFPTNDYRPVHGDDRVVTAGIWTIHFSLDNDMWSSEHRMRDLIKEMELDVVGLLESDLQRIIMGNRDTTQFLAEDLGMYVDYGPGPNKHTWGCALLSQLPHRQLAPTTCCRRPSASWRPPSTPRSTCTASSSTSSSSTRARRRTPRTAACSPSTWPG